MELLKRYFELQNQIYEYFGYKEDWVTIPVADRTDCFWYLGKNEVISAYKMSDFEFGDYYSDEIYRQRFLPKWVYPTDEYTMICVNTHSDGNKYLAVYDNNKRLNESPVVYN